LRTVHLRCFAKVNLFLGVLGKRPDGYHEIETILHNVSLVDDVWVEETAGDGIEVVMDAGDVPPGENLAARAAEALARRGVGRAGLRIRIEKSIPVAGGMGGGSADAAAVLIGLAHLSGADVEPTVLEDAAADVGSDVPFFLRGGTQVASGRGERLSPLEMPQPFWFVLGIDGRPLSTAAVYRAWSGPPSGRDRAPTAVVAAGGPREVARHLHNDLEPAAFALRPELAAKKERLLEAGCLGALLSGSGPTLFGLCDDEGSARRAAGVVSGIFDRVEVVRSHARGVEISEAAH
jgi:4-diphosphocytidyl-2-C-methyl-D-erythritol kinase